MGGEEGAPEDRGEGGVGVVRRKKTCLRLSACVHVWVKARARGVLWVLHVFVWCVWTRVWVAACVILMLSQGQV